MAQQKTQQGTPQGGGEAAGRQRGYQSSGGSPGNEPLEDGQLRGVDEDGNIVQGTHGGPDRPKQKGNPRQ